MTLQDIANLGDLPEYRVFKLLAAELIDAKAKLEVIETAMRGPADPVPANLSPAAAG